jgi:DNA-binding SARP family transcriptional activator
LVPQLVLTLCGPVSATLDAGASPAPRSPLGAKALALLAYLALERRPHARESLATLLWGEQPDERARGSLRQALVQLRHALGPVLAVSRASVALDAVVTTDVDALVGPALAPDPRARLAAALAVDVERFLEALALRHCEAFDEWVAATRVRLAERAAAALGEGARDALARLDAPEALALAARWQQLAPHADEPVVACARAHELAGRPAAALAALDAHAARRAVEGAPAPGRAARALADRLRQAGVVPRAPDGATTGGWSDAAMPNDPVGEALARAPLLGRETEWQALREAWGAVVGGAERVVVVEGEPGIGRTRLLDDLARLIVAARGSMVRLRLGESDASVPHGATARLVRATLDLPAVSGTAGQWLAELARLVPELRDRFPGIPVVEPASASVGSWRLFEAVGQLLGALAAERPVAILVDDLHWCDAESAAVLATLAGRGRVSRLLWAVTLSAGAAEHDAPGPRLAGALTTGAGGRRVRLRRLDGGEVARLVVSLGVPAPTDGASERLRALAAAVHAESEGVPGLVAGLLRAARACGALHGDAVGGWDAPDGATGLPADLPASLRGVRGAIAARVDRLPDDAREVLGTLALAELPCDLDLLSRMHGMSRLRVASIGDGLVARGLARETEGGYACAHRLVAGVVGERASALWRREAHRALAQLLAQRHPAPVPGTIARAVARHAAAGGDDVLARRYASDVPAVIADVGALGWAPRRPLGDSAGV